MIVEKVVIDRHEITIWYEPLALLAEEKLYEMEQALSLERRQKAAKIKVAEKRKQSVAAGYLLQLLCNKLAKEQDDLPEIIADENGKLHFLQNVGVHFNISHTSQMVILAYSDVPIGIDIEDLKAGKTAVAERYFMQEEIELAKKSDTDFYKIWTAKEAFVKAVGTGIRMPLSSFSVAGCINEKIRLTWENDIYHIKTNICNVAETVYVMSICVKENE